MQVKKEDGKYICPHNDQCRCLQMKCSTCGWNPAVAKARIVQVLKERGL